MSKTSSAAVAFFVDSDYGDYQRNLDYRQETQEATVYSVATKISQTPALCCHCKRSEVIPDITRLLRRNPSQWQSLGRGSDEHLACFVSRGSQRPRRPQKKGFSRHCSKTLAEKVLFRQLGHVGATHDRVHHSFAIGRRVGRRGFSARVQQVDGEKPGETVISSAAKQSREREGIASSLRSSQ